MNLARLAAGRLRIGFGWAFAERGRLSLAGADGVFESLGQFDDPSFEFGDTLK